VVVEPWVVKRSMTLEVLDVADVGEHDVAVVAGDPATLDDLGRPERHARDELEPARRGAGADDRAQAVAERPRVDPCVVAEDDAVLLEAVQALGDGG